MAATEDRSGLGRLSALAGVTCWSMGNIMVSRFDMPGLWIGFWRLTIGAVIYGLVLHLGGRRISLATLRLVAPAAIVIACEIGIFFTALRTTTVANATIIGALQPIILLAVASRRYRESVTAWLLGATLVAVAGIALVVQGSSSQSEWSLHGDILALVAMFFFSAYFVLVKEIRHKVDTFTLQTASMAIGGVALYPMVGLAARPVGGSRHRPLPHELGPPARVAEPHGPPHAGHSGDLGYRRLDRPRRAGHPGTGARHGRRAGGPCGRDRPGCTPRPDVMPGPSRVYGRGTTFNPYTEAHEP